MSEDAGIANPGQLRLRHGLSDALATRLDLIHNSAESSVADSDSGSGAFFTPGSGIRDRKKSGSGIRTAYPGSYFQVFSIAIIWVISNKGGVYGIFLFYVQYLTLLHLPPPQIPLCRRMLGWRAQDSWDYGIGCQTPDLIHNSTGT